MNSVCWRIRGYILGQILDICAEINPDGIVIPGDVYDKAIPAAEAVELLDAFLATLAGRTIPCWVVSGNHDLAERIAFGSRIMAGQGIHMAPVFNGSSCPTIMADEFGEVDIYLLPFIKPALVRRFYPEAEIDSFLNAVRTVLNNQPLVSDRRHVLVPHQEFHAAQRLCVSGGGYFGETGVYIPGGELPCGTQSPL